MLVANPIYDVIFKTLMQDEESAKLLISAIIDREVLELQYLPQEVATDLLLTDHPDPEKASRTIVLYRMDFKAVIRAADGSQQIVLIELQKAKYAKDVMRFRKYLGIEYANGKYAFDYQQDGKTYQLGMPIIAIFILGEGLWGLEDVTLVRVNHRLVDDYSGQELAFKHPVIESLHHEGYFINSPALRKYQRNEKEKFLSIFKDNGVRHFAIDMPDEDFPAKYGRVLRLLRKAIEQEHVRLQMELEDDAIEEYTSLAKDNQRLRVEILENKLEAEVMRKQIEEDRVQLEQLEKQAEAERTQREQLEKQAEAERTQREQLEKQAEAERTQREQLEKQAEAERIQREQLEKQAEAAQLQAKAERDRMKTLIKAIAATGLSIEQIAQACGLPAEEVAAILSES